LQTTETHGRPGDVPQWLALTLIAAAVLVCYSVSLGYGFVYDDESQVAANPQITSLANTPQFFTTYIGSHAMEGPSNYYRPLFSLWLALNYALFGLNPFGWHLSTVLVHVCVCWMVYALARMYLSEAAAGDDGERWALFAALLFAVLPAHVESVAWVSGVTDPLVGAALLGCYLLWARGRSWQAMLVLACGLLVKETAVIAPVLLLAHERFLRQRRWGAAARRVTPSLVVVGMYLAVRFAVLHQMAHENSAMPLAQKLAALPVVMAFYAVQMVVSPQLALFHDEPFSSTVLGWPKWAALVFAALALGWMGYLAWRSRAARIAALWVVLPLALVMDVAAFLPGEAVHDRYLYLASVGFVVLVAMTLRRWATGSAERSKLSYGVALALLVVCAARTAIASLPWNDNLTLYSRAAAVAPGNASAHNNLAGEYFKRGMAPQAEAEFERAMALSPGYWLPPFNLGYIRMTEKRYAEAADFFRRAIAINPGAGAAYLQLAKADEAMGKYADAEVVMRAALRADARVAEFHMELGAVLLREGKRDEGRRELQLVSAGPKVTPELRRQARELLGAQK